MKRKRKVEIVFEASRAFLLIRPEWRPSCGTEVEMITVFDAARVARVSSYTVYGWSESGEIHSRVTPDGVLFVCPESLARASVSANESPGTGARPTD